VDTSTEQVDKIEAFRPLRVRRASEEVVVVLVDAIRGGLYEPGEKLPRERDLAAALEVSRAVVSEAIKVLERAGVVSVRRGATGGVFVVSRWIPPDVMAAIEGVSYANMQSILEVRRLLETEAALVTGLRRTDDDLADLARLVELLPDLLDDPDEFHAVDVQFHVRIGESSGNELLARLVRETLHALMSSRAHYPVGHVDLAHALRNQQDTLAAIVSGMPELIAQSIDEHLASAEEYFLGGRLPKAPPHAAPL
jgi:GntR family transcriptional repressor for pyruvate dehydrogenase complex